MKTIGLIGGMSWESSLEYYKIINETVKIKLGGLHSAKCLMYSVDFAEIEALQHQNKWDELTDNLALNGAEGVVLGCTEIPLLINQEDVNITVFDTTTIHAISAVEFALVK